MIVNKPIVRCADDYERALQRAAELGTPSEGSAEEAELFALVDAIEKWEARHEEESENWE